MSEVITLFGANLAEFQVTSRLTEMLLNLPDDAYSHTLTWVAALIPIGASLEDSPVCHELSERG